jgi:hypothetical protein
VPLLYVTQQLAFRKYLYINQNLTGLHDKSESWVSLFGAATKLWEYRGVLIGRHAKDRPAFSGVSLIFLYLGGIWLLNLIAPDLIDIDTTKGDPSNVLKLTGNISELAGSQERFVSPLLSAPLNFPYYCYSATSGFTRRCP